VTVLTGRRAKLLVFLAGRRRDGTRGRLARRARRILVREADNDPYREAFLAVVRLWLRYPNDEDWEFLNRQGRRQSDSLAQLVFEEAVNPWRPPGTRALVAAFCVRRGLVPDGAVDRALFFVFTGQAALHRAHDPDGSLLATGYRGLDAVRRGMLRQAMLDTGDLDLVRAVVVDRPGRVRTGAEIDYLTRRLAGAREWAELWQLVRDAPVVPAVVAMPLFADWLPAADADRSLFARLAAASPAAVAAAAEVVRVGRRNQIGGSANAGDVAFAPDHSRLAVTEYGVLLRIYSLPGGKRITMRRECPWPPGSMVYLGDRILATEQFGNGARPSRLFLLKGSRSTILWPDGYPQDVRKVVRVGATYVVATNDGLLFDDGRRVRCEELGLSGDWSWPFGFAGLPADATCGRIALGARDRHDLVILDEDRRNRRPAPGRRDLRTRRHEVRRAGRAGHLCRGPCGAPVAARG
jgi:hypothetical protein